MSKPQVSVIIPAYNAASMIDRALHSVYAQEYPSMEIVVVDDASVDDTAARVRAHESRGAQLIRLDRNSGEGGAVNAGLREARGEFIAFLDADDEWLPGKLARQMPVISAEPTMSFIGCGVQFHFEGGTEDAHVHPPFERGGDAWKHLLARTHVAKPAVVARASILRQVGEFDTEIRIGADQDMWIRLALAGKAGHVPEILVHCHDTPGSLTKVYARRTAEFVLPMIAKHVDRLADRLTADEIDAIWGARYTTIGRNYYNAGMVMEGARFIAAAIRRRHLVLENLRFLVAASPPARLAKRLVRRKRSRREAAE